MTRNASAPAIADAAALPIAPPALRFDTRAEALRFGDGDATAAFAALFPRDGTAVVTRLTGGFSSASFIVTSPQRHLVLRFFSGGIEGGAREIAVLRRVAAAGVAVPEVLATLARADHWVGALTLCAGRTLDAALPHVEAATFAALGAQLARVHAIRMPRAGFLDATGAPTHGPSDGSALLRDYIAAAPATRVGQRLGPALAEAVAELARTAWPRVEAEDLAPRLTHGDFNAKNLLVAAAPHVTLLDWEYALAGIPLMDWGNVARFEADYPPHALEAMADGYRAAGGALGSAWRDAARLADLAALCSFLDRDDASPRTTATARTLIARTVLALSC